MSEIAFLRDLVVLFSVSIVVVYFFDKLGLPAVVGFLVAGAMVGPYGLDFVQDVSHVDVFAEIGVVLLLFTIGVEFSLAHVPSLRAVLRSGLLQIGSTIALSAAAGWAFGLVLGLGAATHDLLDWVEDVTRSVTLESHEVLAFFYPLTGHFGQSHLGDPGRRPIQRA